MILRRATIADAATLAQFAAAAFWDTYRDIDEAEDIADYVAQNLRPEAMEHVLRDPRSTTLLGEVGSTLAGYAVLSHADIPSCVAGPAPIELARFYLGQEFIGQGLGAQLMLETHAEAWRQGARTIWLGVYDRNLRAIRFYERFGFKKVGDKEFLFGGKIYMDPIYASSVRSGV